MVAKELTQKEVAFRDKLLGFVHLLVTDMDAAGELMANGFVWENHLPPHVPFGGRYEGLQGMKDYLGRMLENWVIGDIVFDEVIVDPDERRFVTIGYEKGGQAITTGKHCDMSTVWVAKLDENGKFTYVREYNDTNAMGEAFST